MSNAFEDRSGASGEMVDETPESIRYLGDRADCVGDGGDSDIEGDGFELADLFDTSMHLSLHEKEMHHFQCIEDAVGDDYGACILTEPEGWAVIAAGGKSVGALAAGASTVVGAAAGSTVATNSVAAPGASTEEPPAADVVV